MKKKMGRIFAVALFLMLFVTAIAYATPIDVGVDELYVTPGAITNISVTGYSGGVYTGYYVLDVYTNSGTLLYDNIKAFCADPAFAYTGGIAYTYKMDSLPAGDTRYNKAAWLFTQVGHNGYTEVDVQRAIWQIMGLNPDQYPTALVDAAQLHADFDTSGFVLFSSPRETTTLGKDYQDYIARVPEPTTMLLLGIGLIGLAGVRRTL